MTVLHKHNRMLAKRAVRRVYVSPLIVKSRQLVRQSCPGITTTNSGGYCFRGWEWHCGNRLHGQHMMILVLKAILATLWMFQKRVKKNYRLIYETPRNQSGGAKSFQGETNEAKGIRGISVTEAPAARRRFVWRHRDYSAMRMIGSFKRPSSSRNAPLIKCSELASDYKTDPKIQEKCEKNSEFFHYIPLYVHHSRETLLTKQRNDTGQQHLLLSLKFHIVWQCQSVVN